MIKLLFRLFITFIIILIIFAIVPDKFWQWLKPYFNWEVFSKTIKLGWEKFWQFLQDSSGLNFNDFFDKIKDYFGLDINNIWNDFKNFLANIFTKISEGLK
ncbi:MAG: hypothetical protein NZ866_02865 [Patescibacteria group bacterium]|nr:hypothetical protein [Patescibacteria group bacterium]